MFTHSFRCSGIQGAEQNKALLIIWGVHLPPRAIGLQIAARLSLGLPGCLWRRDAGNWKGNRKEGSACAVMPNAALFKVLTGYIYGSDIYQYSRAMAISDFRFCLQAKGSLNLNYASPVFWVMSLTIFRRVLWSLEIPWLKIDRRN